MEAAKISDGRKGLRDKRGNRIGGGGGRGGGGGSGGEQGGRGRGKMNASLSPRFRQSHGYVIYSSTCRFPGIKFSVATRDKV